MKKLLPFVFAMGSVIVLSNVLVQHLLGPWLTYGALTYPLAFLITDLTNRLYGVSAAKKVVIAGFAVGIVCSAAASLVDLTTLRIAVGSAVAFFVAQSLDLKIFDRLRDLTWWKTPMISSVVGSFIDTALFFSIAFSSITFAIVADGNEWAFELVPLLGMDLSCRCGLLLLWRILW